MPTRAGSFLIAKWNYLVCLFLTNFWNNLLIENAVTTDSMYWLLHIWYQDDPYYVAKD